MKETKQPKTLQPITEKQKELVGDMITKIMNEYASEEQKKVDLLVEKLDNAMKESQQAWDLVRGLIELLREIDQEKIDSFMKAKADTIYSTEDLLGQEKKDIS